MRNAAAVFASLMLLVASAGGARASAKTVAAGEVSTRVVRQDMDLPALLRASLDEEVGALDHASVPADKSYVVSLSLVRLEADPLARGASVTCVVSAALRDAKGGTLRAVRESYVHAENTGKQADLERAAMKNAIHDAVTGVPITMR